MKFKAMDHTSKTNDVKILLQTTLIWRVATGKRNLNANIYIYIYIYIYITYYLLLITYYLIILRWKLRAEKNKYPSGVARWTDFFLGAQIFGSDLLHTNYLRVYDHFMVLAHKELKM